jgi:hypothetical protein
MAQILAVSRSTLPPHGRIACRSCFSGDGEIQAIGKWQMVNDPGAWGSATPKILVLGFSKGFTQASAYRTGRFEDIPFKDMRPRLTEELRLLGVLGPAESVDGKMVPSERDLAFGSLVRCSLSRMNDNSSLECTGKVMPKAFNEEISSRLRRCAEAFLTLLPPTVRLVLMLGTTDSYVEGCRGVIRSLYGPRFSDINSISYRTDDVVWTHISHPSGLNGHHPAWMAGDPSSKPGRKRNLAMDAIRLSGVNDAL